jgi:sialate O-acetylesterase
MTGMIAIYLFIARRLALMILLVAASFSLQARQFTVDASLQSNMVIQQQKPLRIWGDAPAGTIIQVKADWWPDIFEDTSDSNGQWKLELPVPAAKPGDFESHQLKLWSPDKELLFSNILIGDVWLCSGQSNMEMTVAPALPWTQGTLHYQQEIANALYPQIRLYKVETGFSKIPMRQGNGKWSICSPKTVSGYSAVAYFFARDLFLQLRIPIGIVVSSIGSSAAQAWTSRDTLAADPVLNNKYLYPYDTSARSMENLELKPNADKVTRPALLYNAMIYPLREISLKGILWYQGEANRRDHALYTRLLSAMIRNWRNLFQQGELPFYYVQVTPFTWRESDPASYYYAEFREAQAAVRQHVTNTEMVVTMDIGDPNNIHPRNKQDVGYRLAQIALAREYHFSDRVFRGPDFAKQEIMNDTVIIYFEPASIGSGLATSDGKEPRHFYIAGEDEIFFPAKASIRNNQVWLYADNVKKPVAVRYAFTNYPVTNFGNKEGFPAVPFRSAF